MNPACQNNPSIRLGMVVALPSEARAMLGKRQWLHSGDLAQCSCGGSEDVNILWVRCGVGTEKASRAAAFLVEQGVTHLGIAGVSGGLDPDLGSGQLVLASEIVDEGGKRWQVAPAFKRIMTACFGRKIRNGSILTTAAPLLTDVQKKLWFERTKALAVDMESAAVAQVASAAGLPFFALRAICDEAARSVPAALFDLVDDMGRPRPIKLIGSLIKQPSLIPVLMRMQGDFSRALRALRYGWQVCCHLKPVDFNGGEEQV